MPEPSHWASLDVREWLCSDSLPNDWTLQPLANREPGQSLEETHLHCLYLWALDRRWGWECKLTASVLDSALFPTIDTIYSIHMQRLRILLKKKGGVLAKQLDKLSIFDQLTWLRALVYSLTLCFQMYRSLRWSQRSESIASRRLYCMLISMSLLSKTRFIHNAHAITARKRFQWNWSQAALSLLPETTASCGHKAAVI